MVAAGHVLGITTRSEDARAAIEAAGAECWIATPARLGTLRAALDGVTLACWLLAGASGAAEDVRELHASRLERFMRQLIDTTVRGFIYEASLPRAEARDALPGRISAVPARVLAEGAQVVRAMGAQHAIPVVVIERAETEQAWLQRMHAAVRSLLGDAVSYPETNP
jgi:hypothetical protein